MEKWRKIIRINKLTKRFVLSFLIVLVLPIICFICLFMRYYREIYRDNILGQAENSVQITVREVERNIAGFQSIVTYNGLDPRMTRYALKKDHNGTKVQEILKAELATHAVLDDICYYNEVRPNAIYTKSGTYSLAYYARLYAQLDSREELLEQIKNIKGQGWLLWDKSSKNSESVVPSLQYVISTSLSEWWIFTISNEMLEQLISMEGSYTLLTDKDGNILYTAGVPIQTDYVEFTVKSSVGDINMTRYIHEKELFADLDIWQKYFFVAVFLILLIGGILIGVLTQYNEQPVQRLQVYCREKIRDIPMELGGLEVFHYAMKTMEKQVLLMERKEKRKQLLLHMLYGKECDTDSFRDRLVEEKMFCDAECFRVILVESVGCEQGNMEKLALYIGTVQEDEYEIRLAESSDKATIVMIVGMSEQADKRIRLKIQKMAADFEESIGQELYFYVGEKYSDINKVTLSYSQAIACKQKQTSSHKDKIVYYRNDGKYDRKRWYPNQELDELYNALIDTDLETVILVTNKLRNVMREHGDNRFSGLALYYDVLNTYYRAQSKLERDEDWEFLDVDLLEIRDNKDADQMLLWIQEDYQSYVEKGKAADGGKGTQGDEREDIVANVLTYVDECETPCELSVGMLADRFEVSISNLSHRFKAHTNMKISDYITEKKISYACKLLSETNSSVKEIASLTGYSSPISFIRKFRQDKGMTPMEYRIKERGE